MIRLTHLRSVNFLSMLGHMMLSLCPAGRPSHSKAEGYMNSPALTSAHSRDSTRFVFGRDSIELPPKIDSVVRGIIINRQLFSLDERQHRGLGDIKEMLYGVGTIVAPKGDFLHDGVWQLCYEAHSFEPLRDRERPSNKATLNDSVFVVLWADPEMGGSAHDLQGFNLSYTKPRNVPCTPISVRDLTTTDNGLHLGMTLSQVRKIMGKPKKHVADVYSFEYSRALWKPFRRNTGIRNRASRDSVEYIELSIDGSLDVRVSRGRVVSLEASYLEST